MPWLACKPFGDIHSICPQANTPILVQDVLSELLQELDGVNNGLRVGNQVFSSFAYVIYLYLYQNCKHLLIPVLNILKISVFILASVKVNTKNNNANITIISISLSSLYYCLLC